MQHHGLAGGICPLIKRRKSIKEQNTEKEKKRTKSSNVKILGGIETLFEKLKNVTATDEALPLDPKILPLNNLPWGCP